MLQKFIPIYNVKQFREKVVTILKSSPHKNQSWFNGDKSSIQ